MIKVVIIQFDCDSKRMYRHHNITEMDEFEYVCDLEMCKFLSEQQQKKSGKLKSC